MTTPSTPQGFAEKASCSTSAADSLSAAMMKEEVSPSAPILNTFIRCEDVGFTYDGNHYVFSDLNLTVKAGEFLCLLGGNGSGKSTLARLVNGLLFPDAGMVYTFERSTSDRDQLFFIRSNAGLVFQNPDDQLVASIVENDVAFGPENLGIPNPELRNRVDGALKTVGLSDFALRETNALSGGQKQRVAIAGALALDPALLILDEASAMLDPRGRQGLMELCKELHVQGMTIVMITHFMEEAAQADRVVVLHQGTIVQDGTPQTVLSQESVLESLGLDVPFAASFSQRLRAAGVSLESCVETNKLTEQLLARGVALGFTPDGTLTPGSATDLAPMPPTQAAIEQSLLGFENVSFSYSSPQSSKRKTKRASRNTSPAEPSAAWGGDASNPWALRSISLAIQEGEFLGIAGHTGSGKSTLISLLNGLAKPTEGTVYFRGQSLQDKAVALEARKAIGVVFQYPERQLFAATVYDDVAFGPRQQKLSPEEVEARVRRALELVEVPFDDVYAKSPFALSGGQQRRVAMAGILAMRPEVLVLDEPTAGLDPAGREEILGLIQRLHGQGLTCIMVSHSMDDLARYCTSLLILNEGTLFAEGSPQELFTHPDALHSIGLGVPQAQDLAWTLRKAGWPIPLALYDEQRLATVLLPLLTATEGGDHHE